MCITEDIEFESFVGDISCDFDCLEYLNCCETQIILYNFF